MTAWLKFKAEDGCAPTRANEFAAGLDLRVNRGAWIDPGRVQAFPTGLRVEIPHGCVGLVRGRSGMAFKRGIWGFEGTIDEDYRGEIHVLLMNTSDELVKVAQYERVAQLVIVQCGAFIPLRSEVLSSSQRGEAGFGSSGRE